ncbi:MAG TPA: AAA family ATPase [Solirubrobacterales bacterium]
MNETMTAEAGLRTYRGETIESLLPQIREELGADAVIVRQREGLIGGVGGFFQKRCVEVDARPGGPGVDVYDEEPAEGFSEAQDEGALPAGPVAAGDPPAPPVAEASSGLVPPTAPPAGHAFMADEEQHVVRNDGATREGLATTAIQELVGQAQPFAEMLSEARTEPVEPVGPPKARALIEAMVGTGLGEDIAREVVEAVVASAMPFAGAGRLRTLVRNELALRIPVAPLAGPGARTVVMVGPAGSGKSAAIAAIAAAHEAAGIAVERLALEELPARGLRPEGLLLVETPALWGGAEGLAEAARRLGKLKGAEVHLAMRAGTAAAAGTELLEGLAALRPNRLLITSAGETSHLGGVLDVAIRAGLPLGYVAESAAELAPAEPRELARRVTP